MKVTCFVVYPSSQDIAPYGLERRYPVELNVGCSSWQHNTAMRHGFCELLFAGCGNHPGLWDGFEGYPFDAGDSGINNVHRQWAEARVRSMSVGDMVILDWGGMNEYWLCENCGWTLLTPEQYESWRTYPRKYSCCSFELSRWLDSMTAKEKNPVKA